MSLPFEAKLILNTESNKAASTLNSWSNATTLKYCSAVFDELTFPAQASNPFTGGEQFPVCAYGFGFILFISFRAGPCVYSGIRFSRLEEKKFSSHFGFSFVGARSNRIATQLDSYGSQNVQSREIKIIL